MEGHSLASLSVWINKGNIFIQDALEIIDAIPNYAGPAGQGRCLYASAFHLQANSDKLLKYVGSIIMSKEHVQKILIDQRVEEILFEYWNRKRQEDLEAISLEEQALLEQYGHQEGLHTDVNIVGDKEEAKVQVENDSVTVDTATPQAETK